MISKIWRVFFKKENHFLVKQNFYKTPLQNNLLDSNRHHKLKISKYTLVQLKEKQHEMHVY